jgi:hypothetical protein
VVMDYKSIETSVVSFSCPFMFVGDNSGDGAADRRVRSDSGGVAGISERYFDRLGEKTLNEF